MTEYPDPMILFPPSRAAALDRLAEFVPRAGRAYAAERNADRGPGLKPNVSMLSPYVRHRLLTEHEVVGAVLRQHSPNQAEKFIQEVFWRTYWKGWLQMRPAVWRDFLAERDDDRKKAEANSGLARALAEAESGRTGIECFDDWARELVATGYLHNHTRMWFASIWTFTLKLPWTLGADFFLRHLLDADPASNTLSWRWVAGIQTQGKTYLARADNIEQYTQGRYRPKGLAERAEPVRDEGPYSREPLPELEPVPTNQPVLLLVHGDDLCAHQFMPEAVVLAGGIVAKGGDRQAPWPFGDKAAGFLEHAVDDAVERLGGQFGLEAWRVEGLDADRIVEHASAAGVQSVLTSEAPVGPVADGLARLAHELAERGLGLYRLRRDWDDQAWPRAAKGFFPFKKQIPSLLEKAGLG